MIDITTCDENGHWDVWEIKLLCDYRDRLKAALQKIAAYDPGQFRPLEDEIAIWRLATEALAACSGAGPTSGQEKL